MAALAVQTMQPIAGFQPVDHGVLNAFATGNQKAIVIGNQVYFIGARELVLLPPEGWAITKENGMDVAELIGANWMEAKGVLTRPRLQLEPGVEYAAAFIVKRTAGAQNLNNIMLTLEVDGIVVGEKVVDLMLIPADTWVYLHVANYLANGFEENMTVSLANHDKRTWKKGLKILGVVVHRAKDPCPFKK